MKVLALVSNPQKIQVLKDSLEVVCAPDLLEMETAERQAEIEACFKKQDFDYIFADRAALPMLGQVLEADKGLARFPVIALLPSCEDAYVEEALSAGAHECLCLDATNAAVLRMALSKARNYCALKEIHAQAEENFRQRNKMEAVGRLTAGVAHDFNNLLTVVMGNIHLLQRRLEIKMNVDEYAEVAPKVDAIKAVSDKGAELVRRLMIFTRQTELSKEIVEVNACIRETFELLRRTLGEAIEIEMTLSPERWSAYLDPIEFENILINFAVNARDAMPNGGKLTIETENVVLNSRYTMRYQDMAPGQYVMIVISDTGCGMPPHVLKNIFEPFYTTKPPGEGTGLGMSMAYGFVRQCGGFLHVYSEVGNGTVFRIYLPRQMGEGETDAAAENRFAASLPEPAGRGQAKTILVVEDDDVISEITCSMLSGLGYDVLLASNADKAYELLQADACKIDLLFSDVHMPGTLNGVDLARIVREKYKNIPVLLSSGFSENAVPDYIREAGEEVISKPYHRENLQHKILSVMGGGIHGQL